MTIIECYPEEVFTVQCQEEWARSIVERLNAYAAAVHTEEGQQEKAD